MHLVEYIWYLYNYMYSQLYIFTHTNVNTEVTKAQTHNSYYIRTWRTGKHYSTRTVCSLMLTAVHTWCYSPLLYVIYIETIHCIRKYIGIIYIGI